MRLRFITVLPAMALGLGACGDYLGEYEVEEVRLVREIPSDASPTGEPLPYRQYIRVELSSGANLNAAETGPGLYTDADFCPLRNPHRIIAFGPLASDGKAVESWNRSGGLSPDNRDGRYHYFVYVVPNSPPRKLLRNSTDVIREYDLRAGGHDLCLRFFVPGYNIIASRSGTVRIAARLIATAPE
jgi:hypothetical protein